MSEEDKMACAGWHELGRKQAIAEFLHDMDNLPIENVTWVKEHTIRKSKLGEMMGKVQSSMVFLPEITKLKCKWRKLL